MDENSRSENKKEDHDTHCAVGHSICFGSVFGHEHQIRVDAFLQKVLAALSSIALLQLKLILQTVLRVLRDVHTPPDTAEKESAALQFTNTSIWQETNDLNTDFS